jgi:hypothetical protein
MTDATRATADALKLVQQISHEPNQGNRETTTDEYLKVLDAMSIEVLTELTAKIACLRDTPRDTPDPAAISKALREAAILKADTANMRSLTDAVRELQAESIRNKKDLVDATKKLDENTTKLTNRLIWLTWALIVLSIAAPFTDAQKTWLWDKITGQPSATETRQSPQGPFPCD